MQLVLTTFSEVLFMNAIGSSAPNICERNLNDCSSDIEGVSIGTSKYFLCQRCKTCLQDKLTKSGDSMPGWWHHAIANSFVGRPSFESSDFKDDEFLPGY
jgi:hypothetical protein